VDLTGKFSAGAFAPWPFALLAPLAQLNAVSAAPLGNSTGEPCTVLLFAFSFLLPAGA
jgi:hypothetical protein